MNCRISAPFSSTSILVRTISELWSCRQRSGRPRSVKAVQSFSSEIFSDVQLICDLKRWMHEYKQCFFPYDCNNWPLISFHPPPSSPLQSLAMFTLHFQCCYLAPVQLTLSLRAWKTTIIKLFTLAERLPWCWYSPVAYLCLIKAFMAFCWAARSRSVDGKVQHRRQWRARVVKLMWKMLLFFLQDGFLHAAGL